jgi:hypothetical protein
MRESLESLCAHAGTGSRVRSLPARPTALVMRAAAAARLVPFAPYHWLMYSKSLWFDIEHVQHGLGWQPRYSNAEMFADSYDWFTLNRGCTTDSDKSQHRTATKQGALKLLKAATRVLPS